ncbi:MAG: hypothetical protein SGILL_007879 [Bacillariaceae sp.]
MAFRGDSRNLVHNDDNDDGGHHHVYVYAKGSGHQPLPTGDYDHDDDADDAIELTGIASGKYKDSDDDDGGDDCDCDDDNHDTFQDELPHGTVATTTILSRDTTTAIGSARTPWYLTAIILLSEVMGTGILSLPYAAKTLGWASTLMAVPLFAAIASYSGFLLSKVHQEDSKLHSFAEASTKLLGVTFGKVTKVCMLLNWGATAIYYLIATADGIGDIVGPGSLQCAYQRAAVAALLLVLPSQCRDFYAISKYLSAPSTCAIVIMVFLIIGNLLMSQQSSSSGNTNNNSFGATTTVLPQEGTTPLDYLEALSAFVFANQGHAIFLELMAEMRDAYQFPKACILAYSIMCVMYALTVVVAYGIMGVNTEEFLPDILPPGAIQTTVGCLVTFHITVSYVISCQPLHMWIHETVFPSTFQEESVKGKIHWFVLTCGYLAFGFFVGNLIPFFADVQALIGSLFGAPTIFGWPVAFYFMIQRRKAASWHETIQHMGWGHVAICLFFLLVCTPVFVILGTTGALSSIVRDAEEGAKPFQCDGA